MPRLTPPATLAKLSRIFFIFLLASLSFFLLRYWHRKKRRVVYAMRIETRRQDLWQVNGLNVVADVEVPCSAYAHEMIGRVHSFVVNSL